MWELIGISAIYAFAIYFSGNTIFSSLNVIQNTTDVSNDWSIEIKATLASILWAVITVFNL